MDERLSQLLALLVEDVIASGEPVGSQSLVEAHDLGVSSATVRNWFASLEDMGYITQPHTSGGRIPTEKGYQHYASSLMGRKSLGKRERAELERAAQLAADRERKLKNLAKAAAEGVGVAAVLGLNEADTFYTGLTQLFSQPEFRAAEHIRGLGAILDQLDEVLMRLRGHAFATPTVLVGSECPFGNMCGAVLITLEDGALAGMFGPMRMDYRSAVAHLDAFKDMMDPRLRGNDN